ncbi:Zinc finger protein 510 [Amphibalanus amphitrite]|uniref:Zinc finger protein 510 n=1 Tax=Amphibalanus amphitrite TaxID=1232801 RepID=A0A6A4X3N5_AMPAM|nr:Zinc finger protein 510 [Amphibalanus amphitrite]
MIAPPDGWAITNNRLAIARPSLSDIARSLFGGVDTVDGRGQTIRPRPLYGYVGTLSGELSSVRVGSKYISGPKMDPESGDLDTACGEDPLMIDEGLPAATALSPPEPAQYILPDVPPAQAEGGELGTEPAAEKQYHDLKPPVSARTAPDAPSLLAVKQECLGLPLGAPPEPERAASRGSAGTRRSRRLAVETMPFKKRKRIVAPDLDQQDEYLLPEHVQSQVEQAAPPTCGRRLRPKRAAQLAASVEVDHESPERPVSASPKAEIRQEAPAEVAPATGGGETERGDAPPPRRKRGRPRKSQAPQRCAPPVEDDVTAAGDGDPVARQPPAAAEVRPEEPPALPRRGRKSAVPARRCRQPGRPPAAAPNTTGSPLPAAADSQADDPPREECARPPSPPTVELSRVTCSGLSVSRPLTLTDELRLLEVPGRRRQRPCPFCGSLTGCPPPDVAGEHSHAPETPLTPRRRLRVVVDGTAPSDGLGQLRPILLGDQDAARVAVDVACRRRGRRRTTSGSQGSSGTQDLECRTCGKVMLSLSRLKKHQLVHTDERPFHCDKCPKSFKSIHVLNAHQLTHINYRPFRCELCRQTFAKKWTLRGHMTTHDRCDGADGLKCSTCGCEFLDRSTYDSHIKIHTGERKWECKVCHRGFAKKLKLRKHMVVHSQAMLHKCHLCDREFRWKEKLVKHVMLHTGERPFKCGEPRCTKSFRAHSDLNVHLRNVHKKQPKKLDYPIVL